MANYEYSPFGELLRASGPLAKVNPFRFSTKYADDETDLVYYGYRYYNASMGRWLSRDPIGEKGGINEYIIVNNNVIDGIDLDGRAPGIPTGIGTIIGDLDILNTAVTRWRGLGWTFAPDNLQSFIDNKKTDFNAYKHHLMVKNNVDWRRAAWEHFKKLADDKTPCGPIGDKKLVGVKEGGDVSNVRSLPQQFEFRFGTILDGGAEKNEMFYALFGSHYDYFGQFCLTPAGKWSADINVVLWDPLTYPINATGGALRVVADLYAAAHDLENTFGWNGKPPAFVYAVWADHFDSDKRP